MVKFSIAAYTAPMVKVIIDSKFCFATLLLYVDLTYVRHHPMTLTHSLALSCQVKVGILVYVIQ